MKCRIPASSISLGSLAVLSLRALRRVTMFCSAVSRIARVLTVVQLLGGELRVIGIDELATDRFCLTNTMCSLDSLRLNISLPDWLAENDTRGRDEVSVESMVGLVNMYM